MCRVSSLSFLFFLLLKYLLGVGRDVGHDDVAGLVLLFLRGGGVGIAMLKTQILRDEESHDGRQIEHSLYVHGAQVVVFCVPHPAHTYKGNQSINHSC